LPHFALPNLKWGRCPPKIVLALTLQPKDTLSAVTIKQNAQAGHGDYVTATAVLNARNTDWTQHSPLSCKTSRTRVRSVGCTLFMLICF